jgi:hypothetical protein
MKAPSKLIFSMHFLIPVLTGMVLLFSSFYPEPAESKLKADVYKGFIAIYNFQFQKADSIITVVKRENPNNAGSYLMSANYYWWKIISGDDTKENRSEYLKSLDQAKAIVGKRKSTLSDDDNYCLISIYAYRARFEAMNKNYIQALSSINNCVASIKQSFNKEDRYEPFYLTTGLYNYMIAQVNHKHPILYPYTVFLPDGDKKKGLAMLQKTAASTDPLLSTEAMYFLMKINLEEEKSYTNAVSYGQRLANGFPANLLYRFYYLKSLLAAENKEEALRQYKIISTFSASNDELDTHQRVYFVGLSRQCLKDSGVTY